MSQNVGHVKHCNDPKCRGGCTSTDEWPPKFTITPEGAAGLFLTAHCPNCNARVAIEALTELLNLYAEAGYKKGLEANHE